VTDLAKTHREDEMNEAYNVVIVLIAAVVVLHFFAGR
jgi:hypothetical protein